MAPWRWTIHETLEHLRRGEISAVEVTRAYLDRIEALDPLLHAYLTVTPEEALAQAREADARWAAWRRDPSTPLPLLNGIPLAIKDVICVRGVRCTCGSRILENFIPPYEATAVAS